MTRKAETPHERLASEVLSKGEFDDVPAFAAAAPELQAAIVAAIGDAEAVHLYPARNAWVDGYDRSEQDVPASVAAHLLAHIPPPFYTTADAAKAGRLLTE